MLPVGVDRIRPSEWRVVRWIGLFLPFGGELLGPGEERLRLRWVRCGEGDRCRVRSFRAWRVCGGRGCEVDGERGEGGGWIVMRRRERRRTRAGRLPRERPRRGGQEERVDSDGDGGFGCWFEDCFAD